MTRGSDDEKARGQPGTDRKARLGAALRANLARRKAQARARSGGPEKEGRTGEDTPAGKEQ
ncbi:hypothetical protein DRV85_00640 [Rhodosalinus halophilus]|uniref:Uncharacterized protein n=1 Tax=Rhodosalinus halophilus TaxID=2259333 RepID=A0A365UET9_9RHOB|nr:hypothetical protein [Rhodosalinus halophilus]RBI87474.1 hypothetical protein DRV85_00640 [Rhodosalinus halophilus]